MSDWLRKFGRVLSTGGMSLLEQKHPCEISAAHEGETKRVGPYWLCMDCCLDFTGWFVEQRRRAGSL